MAKTVSLGAALLIYFGMIVIAMMITVPELKAVTFAWLFPIGLGMFFRSNEQGTGYVALIVPYIVYVCLFLMCLATRRKLVFWLVIGILALCLMMNVAGCRRMLTGFSRVT